MAKAEVEAKIESGGLLVSPGWLILTYLVLTFAELLLSPMGISFVSKVAPPKYKGMMMGGWFVATAVGNFLTVIPALLWCKVPLYVVWTTLAVLCLLSFIFIFSQMKRLEKWLTPFPIYQKKPSQILRWLFRCLPLKSNSQFGEIGL